MHRIVEDPFNDEDATCRSLFSILGIEVPDDHRLTTAETLQTIVYGRKISILSPVRSEARTLLLFFKRFKCISLGYLLLLFSLP